MNGGGDDIQAGTWVMLALIGSFTGMIFKVAGGIIGGGIAGYLTGSPE